MLAIVILLTPSRSSSTSSTVSHDRGELHCHRGVDATCSRPVSPSSGCFFNFIAAFGGGVKVANTMGKGVIQFEMLKSQGTRWG